MKVHSKYFWNCKRIAVTAIAGFALASLFCGTCGAVEQGCALNYEVSWVAAEVLRHVVQACWQLVPAYLYENSGCYEHLLQIMASVWPLLCVIAS